MNTYDKILENTYKLFLKKGFHNVSSEDISSNSNISPGTLYYHFKNKDEIVVAVLDKYVLGTYYECLNSVKQLDSTDSYLILSYFYREMLGLDENYNHKEIFAREEDFKKILSISVEGIQEYEVISKNYNKFNAEYTSVLKNIILNGQKNNEIRDDLDVDGSILFIKSNINGIFFLWMVEDGFDCKKVIESNVKQLWEYIKK